MQWSDVTRPPSPRTLRQFAGLCLVVFGGLAIWTAVQGNNAAATRVFAALALGIGPVGLLAPRLIRPVFVAWMVVAFPIGWTVSRVLLALVFYGLFTPLGLIFRMMGRDRLRLRRQPHRATYWTAKTQPTQMRDYLRQF